MMFMNEYEIDLAVERHTFDPVVLKAARFLVAFKDEVNAHSDGWAYWAPPVRAAKKLMELIQHPYGTTETDLRAALSPIKSFYTRRGNAAGMTFPEVA